MCTKKPATIRRKHSGTEVTTMMEKLVIQVPAADLQTREVQRS